MANVFDTAKYILEQRGKMSTMKLQKLCYYSQAWSLVWDDAPLFDEEFRAWANGPVCEELFRRTQGQFYANVEDEYGGDGDLTDNQKDSINIVLAHYADHDAQWLSRLSHMEEPWKNARLNLDDTDRGHEIITKESMAVYYGSL